MVAIERNWSAVYLASLPTSARQQFLASLSESEALWLRYDWQFWARNEQLAPHGDWFVWFLRAGRGFGKTRTGAEFIRAEVEAGRARRIALVGETKADVRDTMIEVGDSALLNISSPWFRPSYEPSKRRVTWPNGAIGIIYSGDEPKQLRGPQHDLAWVDELAKFKYPQETWDQLLMGLRLGKQPRIVVTTTPKPISVVKKILADPYTVDVQRPTHDNISNLSPVYIKRVITPLLDTRLGQQEIRGEILEDTPGALWRLGLIDSLRVESAPPLARVVVGVDPEATSSEESAETGILVAGMDERGHGYVVEDVSVRGTPATWAGRAVNAYQRWRADVIVGETNNGGEMVGYTVMTTDPTANYKAVHASRGKFTRAEPIAALYEQGRIHHVGRLPDLEDQMCTWVQGAKSPDRMDALVWALTELFLEQSETEEGYVIYDDRVQVSPY